MLIQRAAASHLWSYPLFRIVSKIVRPSLLLSRAYPRSPPPSTACLHPCLSESPGQCRGRHRRFPLERSQHPPPCESSPPGCPSGGECSPELAVPHGTIRFQSRAAIVRSLLESPDPLEFHFAPKSLPRTTSGPTPGPFRPAAVDAVGKK